MKGLETKEGKEDLISDKDPLEKDQIPFLKNQIDSL